MPELDLDAIETRAGAATPGPWHGPHDEFGCVHIGDYGWVCGAGTNAPEYDVDSEQGKADAEFIAHARADIPDLVAEVRRLRKQIQRVRDVTLQANEKVGLLRPAQILRAIDDEEASRA